MSRRRSHSPSASPPNLPKRIKLESSPSVDGDDEEPESCIICLQTIVDKTRLPACNHDSLCFECILVWTEQSRKCPLCSTPIGPYLIHNIRSLETEDFQKHFLPPLRTSSPPPIPIPLSVFRTQSANHRRSNDRRPMEWGVPRGRRERDRDEEDVLERAVEKRRWVYRNKLYAKHISSNPHTLFRPPPTPSQFNASPTLQARTTAFLRRELRVWRNLDVEFLTTFIVSLLKSIDVRSESAIKLLGEFLDLDGDDERYSGKGSNAEHFAHELYTYLRSPYPDLSVYDAVIQYDITPRRSTSRKPSDERNRSAERYRPRSPSPRRRSPPPRKYSYRRRSSSPPSRRREGKAGMDSWVAHDDDDVAEVASSRAYNDRSKGTYSRTRVDSWVADDISENENGSDEEVDDRTRRRRRSRSRGASPVVQSRSPTPEPEPDNSVQQPPPVPIEKPKPTRTVEPRRKNPLLSLQAHLAKANTERARLAPEGPSSATDSKPRVSLQSPPGEENGQPSLLGRLSIATPSTLPSGSATVTDSGKPSARRVSGPEVTAQARASVVKHLTAGANDSTLRARLLERLAEERKTAGAEPSTADTPMSTTSAEPPSKRVLDHKARLASEKLKAKLDAEKREAAESEEAALKSKLIQRKSISIKGQALGMSS